MVDQAVFARGSLRTSVRRQRWPCPRSAWRSSAGSRCRSACPPPSPGCGRPQPAGRLAGPGRRGRRGGDGGRPTGWPWLAPSGLAGCPVHLGTKRREKARDEATTCVRKSCHAGPSTGTSEHRHLWLASPSRAKNGGHPADPQAAPLGWWRTVWAGVRDGLSILSSMSMVPFTSLPRAHPNTSVHTCLFP